MTDLAPDPKRWTDSTIELYRAEDGRLAGRLTVAGVPYHIRAWHNGDAPYKIKFEAQPVSDGWVEAYGEHLSKRFKG